MGLAIAAQFQVAVMIETKSLEGGSESDTKMLRSLIERVRDAMAQNGENLNRVNRSVEGESMSHLHLLRWHAALADASYCASHTITQ